MANDTPPNGQDDPSAIRGAAHNEAAMTEATSPQPPNVAALSRRNLWIAPGGAAAIIIGSLMPWATGPFGISVSGTSGDGKITIVLGIAMAVFTWVMATKRWAIAGLMVTSAFVAALMVYEVVHISSPPIIASIGIGVILCLAGAFAGLVGGFLALRMPAPFRDSANTPARRSGMSRPVPVWSLMLTALLCLAIGALGVQTTKTTSTATPALTTATPVPSRSGPTIHPSRATTQTATPVPGPVDLSGVATETTDNFTLPAGDALADWTASTQCTFSFDIQDPAATGDPPPPLFKGDTGFGQIANNEIGMTPNGEVNLVGLSGGTYQVSVTATPTSTTPAPGTHCPWTIKFTPATPGR